MPYLYSSMRTHLLFLAVGLVGFSLPLSSCKVDARDKFVGAWSGTVNCGRSVEQVSLIAVKSTVKAAAIVIAVDNFNIRARLTSSTTLDIPSQRITSGGVAITVSGNGNLNGNVLTLNITYSSGRRGFTCVYSLTRQ